ncbi:MAG: DUF3788 domain-containing protein [Ignavibacteriales bacterium]|nr:DUF3788 domain-containing protein [Ignavibacteriales bacterium]
MDISIFSEKSIIPDQQMLKQALGTSYQLWDDIQTLVNTMKPKLIEEWNYSGVKYGWNFRLKDKKRSIIYMLPRESYFKVAFIFGEKATAAVLASSVPMFIKSELSAARVYAEGRGIRIDVKDANILPAIQELLHIKFSY